MKQRTLAREVSIKGNALHTGDAVTLTMKPAPAGHGIVFKRTAFWIARAQGRVWSYVTNDIGPMASGR